MTVKYAVYPGPVRSRTDGDRHHVGAGNLMQLYGVDPRECVVVEWNKPVTDRIAEQIKDLIVLGPRYDGNYKLPESKQ